MIAPVIGYLAGARPLQVRMSPNNPDLAYDPAESSHLIRRHGDRSSGRGPCS